MTLAFLAKRIAEIFGFLIFLTGFILLISLISYSPEDPNFIFPDNREIKNLKLANQLLKLRRSKKEEKDFQINQSNIQAQAQANAQAQQVAAQAEIQKIKL